MFGRQPRLPVDLGYHVEGNSPVSTNEYAAHVVGKLDRAFERVRHTMSSTQDRQKALYNRKVHGDPCNVGDHVFLFSPAVKPGQSRKLHHPWIGPYWVTKQLSEVTYRIQRVDGSRSRQRLVVHFDRLRPSPSPEPTESHVYSPGPTPDHIDLMQNPVGEPVPSWQAQLVDTPDEQPPPTSPGATDNVPLTPRYPTRDRRPPDRYVAVVAN